MIASPFSDGSVIVTDPNNNSRIWSGGAFQFALAVCRIDNGGASWNRTILSTIGDCRSIAVARSNPNVIFAGGRSSAGQPWLFKTTDGGAGWDTLDGLGYDTTLLALAVHPGNPNIVFAGKGDGVHRSTDAGNSWTATGLANVRSLAIDPDAPETVYAGTSNGVYVNASGSGWAAMNDGIECPAITDLKISPDHCLIAGTYGSGIYRWHINTGIVEQIMTENSFLVNAFPDPSRGQVTFTIKQSVPFQAGENLRFMHEAVSEELVIYDVNGRSIRSFPLPFTRRAESSIVVWNGLDDRNRAVPAGVYFYRLSTGGKKDVGSLIIIR